MPHPTHLLKLVGVFLIAGTLQDPAAAASPEDFYTQGGVEPTFEEVMASGKLPRGKNSGTGFKGERIKINHDLLEDGPNAHRPLLDDLMIHTLGNSVIREDDFSKWTRWYQEDKNTQIFRLFKGEENVRNSRKLAARIEAFSSFGWKEGDGWQEWVATYTIIKPIRCAIFQAKNPKNHWSVMINMNEDGDVILNHRAADNKTMARNMVGKPFHIRIRENGRDYEVYLNGKKEGEGSWERPTGMTNFRWGMYVGAKEVKNDAMILVTGAAINPKDVGESPDQLVTAEAEPEPEAPEEPGIPIPSRTWTNREGNRVTAEARFDPETQDIKLKVRDKWVDYPLANLSDSDRRELAKVMEILPEILPD